MKKLNNNSDFFFTVKRLKYPLYINVNSTI